MSNGYVDKARVLGTDYDIHVPDGAITRAKLDADLQEKTDAVNDLKSALDTMADFYSKETNVALSGTEKGSFISSATETWSTSGSPAPRSWVKSVPEGAVRCKITANNDYGAAIAFLTSSDTTTGATPNYCIGTGRISIPAGTTMIFNVPSDAKYIYVTLKDGSKNLLANKKIFALNFIQRNQVYVALYAAQPLRQFLSLLLSGVDPVRQRIFKDHTPPGLLNIISAGFQYFFDRPAPCHRHGFPSDLIVRGVKRNAQGHGKVFIRKRVHFRHDPAG